MKQQLGSRVPTGKMNKAQRENRLLALTDLIRIHKMHLGKIDNEIVTMAIQLRDRRAAQAIRKRLLAELIDERMTLEKETT
jgi:hypothetical protein